MGIIVVILIALVVTIRATRDPNNMLFYGLVSKADYILMSFLVWLILVCVGGIFLFLVGEIVALGFGTDRVEVRREWQLVSLGDNQKIKGEFSGSFLYKHGTIDQSFVYTGYAITGENQYNLVEAPANITTIKFVEEDFHSERHVLIHEPPAIYYWLLPKNLREEETKAFTFYIPEDSIVTEFNLNAE